MNERKKNRHIQALLRKCDQSDDGKRMKKSAFYLSTDMGVQMGTQTFFHHKNEYAKPNEKKQRTKQTNTETSNQKPRIIL